MGLDAVELVLAFEEEFGIEFDDAAAAEMATPRHVIDYIAARLSDPGCCPSPVYAEKAGKDRERIARRVKEIVIAQLGIDPSQYHEDARFIEDFGVD